MSVSLPRDPNLHVLFAETKMSAGKGDNRPGIVGRDVSTMGIGAAFCACLFRGCEKLDINGVTYLVNKEKFEGLARNLGYNTSKMNHQDIANRMQKNIESAKKGAVKVAEYVEKQYKAKALGELSLIFDKQGQIAIHKNDLDKVLDFIGLPAAHKKTVIDKLPVNPTSRDIYQISKENFIKVLQDKGVEHDIPKDPPKNVPEALKPFCKTFLNFLHHNASEKDVVNASNKLVEPQTTTTTTTTTTTPHTPPKTPTPTPTTTAPTEPTTTTTTATTTIPSSLSTSGLRHAPKVKPDNQMLVSLDQLQSLLINEPTEKSVSSIDLRVLTTPLMIGNKALTALPKAEQRQAVGQELAKLGGEMTSPKQLQLIAAKFVLSGWDEVRSDFDKLSMKEKPQVLWMAGQQFHGHARAPEALRNDIQKGMQRLISHCATAFISGQQKDDFKELLTFIRSIDVGGKQLTAGGEEKEEKQVTIQQDFENRLSTVLSGRKEAMNSDVLAEPLHDVVTTIAQDAQAFGFLDDVKGYLNTELKNAGSDKSVDELLMEAQASVQDAEDLEDPDNREAYMKEKFSDEYKETYSLVFSWEGVEFKEPKEKSLKTQHDAKKNHIQSNFESFSKIEGVNPKTLIALFHVDPELRVDIRQEMGVEDPADREVLRTILKETKNPDAKLWDEVLFGEEMWMLEVPVEEMQPATKQASPQAVHRSPEHKPVEKPSTQATDKNIQVKDLRGKHPEFRLGWFEQNPPKGTGNKKKEHDLYKDQFIGLVNRFKKNDFEIDYKKNGGEAFALLWALNLDSKAKGLSKDLKEAVQYLQKNRPEIRKNLDLKALYALCEIAGTSGNYFVSANNNTRNEMLQALQAKHKAMYQTNNKDAACQEFKAYLNDGVHAFSNEKNQGAVDFLTKLLDAVTKAES